ncbi:MAG: SGNH/GDSL hydrolase family protein [Jatrophihabitans sp.]
MRKSRLVTLVLSAFASLIAVLALAVPAFAAGDNYVALGDSYSSGVGAGDYISSSGSCDRSPNAYSAVWADSHSPASYSSVACSGATTDDVIDGQVSALSSATSLVSITIGGNDVGFSNIMETCVVDGEDDCIAAVQGAENKAQTVLPGKLDAAYDAISSNAPNARVVVLGYPDFYQLGVWYCVGLSGDSRAKIDEGIDMADSIISQAAARHGFAFADVRSGFVHHQLCSGDKWLHSLNVTDITESYHPTADGQSGGYLPAFSNAAG